MHPTGCNEEQKAPDSCCAANAGLRVASPTEQAAESARYHCEEMQRAQRAAHFLRDNPAFDEFISLVRQGVIRF